MRSVRARRCRVAVSCCVTLFGVLLAGLLGSVPARSDSALVAAASSLRQVWPTLMQHFEGDVQTSFGASGTLAQQILHGAPFELFLSADTETVDWLLARHTPSASTPGGDEAAVGQAQVYAVGKLVLILRRGGPGDVEVGAERSATNLLQSSWLSRLALANPRHAPYGKAAERWLADTANTADASSGPLKVVGENAAQAVQFVLSGAADAALVPASLVQAADVRSRVHVVPLAAAERWAVRHAMVLLPGAGDTARALHAYLLSDTAQRIFADAGFRMR